MCFNFGSSNQIQLDSFQQNAESLHVIMGKHQLGSFKLKNWGCTKQDPYVMSWNF